jgi:hypothetical protein
MWQVCSGSRLTWGLGREPSRPRRELKPECFQTWSLLVVFGAELKRRNSQTPDGPPREEGSLKQREEVRQVC